VKRIRSDNELVTKEMAKFCKERGIVAEYSPPYEKDFAGIVERANETIMNDARAALDTANLPNSFWGDMALITTHVRHKLLVSGMKATPFETLFGQKPKVDYLKIPVCRATAHVPKPVHKLSHKAEICILIGLNDNQTLTNC